MFGPGRRGVPGVPPRSPSGPGRVMTDATRRREQGRMRGRRPERYAQPRARRHEALPHAKGRQSRVLKIGSILQRSARLVKNSDRNATAGQTRV